MNSASVLMNLAPTAAAAPATSGAEQPAAGTRGFDQALASAQSQTGTRPDSPETEAVTMELASSLIVRGALPAGQQDAQVAPVAEDGVEIDTDVAEDAAGSGAAAILAQMLAGSSPLGGAEVPPVADAVTRAISLPPAAPPAGAAKAGEGGSSAAGEDSGTSPDARAASLDSSSADPQQAAAERPREKLFELPPSAAQPMQTASQGGSSAAQAVVQAAAGALRDVAPAAAIPAPAHASMREPVGTARWADELGSHLVLMSVRGQQQGSLTLTPEHLGPVEVQISVNRDTANVWFGAQHADTRTALAEAMPRLRELLASSGLSLGQSGVSEQAPRGNPSPPPSPAGGGGRGIDASTVVETSTQAWRVWRPGHIDTYA